jgi:hypothetical protein
MSVSVAEPPDAAAANADPGSIDATTRRLLALVETALDGGRTAEVPDAAVQRLFAAALRLHARKTDEEQRHFAPVAPDAAVSTTDVAVAVTELLRAADLNLFDLSMWASRPRYPRDDNAGRL